MIDFKKAQHFVYTNGILWERAVFAYLFENGSLEHVQDCLRAYQNPDGGYGHALEHDVRYPGSHPLALEFLLRILRDHDLPPGDLLDRAASWVENNQNDDGSLRNPPQLLDYPHAPWWNQGGQAEPDSIVGNLLAFGKANSKIVAKTRQWLQKNRTLSAIESQEWLFMMYHAYDYFMQDDEFPDIDIYRETTIKHIIELIKIAPKEQYDTIFLFAPTPESTIAHRIPEFIQQVLDTIEAQQNDDGSWHDQHGLPQWYPKVTINNLLTLKRYGRWSN